MFVAAKKMIIIGFFEYLKLAYGGEEKQNT